MDDTVTTPIKSTTISSSKMMGRDVGDTNSSSPGKESKIGKLSRILRTTRVKVNETENQIKDIDKIVKINAEKITRLKNIIKIQKSTLAENLSSLDQKAEFASVEKSLNAIIETLRKEKKAEDKAAEDARKKGERNRAKNREKKLESSLGKGIKQFTGKIIKPFKSIFDKIFDFLLNVLLGRTVIKLIDWFSDDENKEKIDNLINFVKDWWPALTAAVLLFGTGFGSLAAGIVSIVAGFIPKMIGVIAKLTMVIAKSPIALPVLAAAAAGIGIYGIGKMLGNDKVAENEGKRQEITRKGLEEAPSTKDMSAGDREALVQGSRQRDAGGSGSLNNMPNQFIDPLGIRNDPTGMGGMRGMGGMNRFNGGGKVPGKGPNKDTVPAMLSPGEFVMSRGAVDKFGTGILASMNSIGGGNNKPKISDGVTYASGGGMVGNNNYGSNLKFKSPIMGYPNYEKPTDEAGQFFSRIYKAAKAAGDPFPEIVAAQAVEESNFGRSPLAMEANNLFGQDAPSDYPPSQTYKYIDPIEGEHTAIKFKSIEDSVKYRVRIWKEYYGDAKTPSEAITNLATAGYNPHAIYPGKINGVLRDYGIVPNQPRPNMNDVRPTNQPTFANRVEDTPVGPKGLIQSLTDSEGLSGIYMNPINKIFGNQSKTQPNLQTPAQISSSQTKKTSNIKPLERSAPKVSFLPLPTSNDDTPIADASGRTTIPPFSAATQGSRFKKQVLGMVT
jgi:flagellum-specific peptidoglycan hydrolase FlgJ